MDRNRRVKWASEMSFVGTAESGHSMVIDSDKKIGTSSMELLPLSMARCACAHFVEEGTAFEEAAVERAMELTLEQYCSASAQMAALAEIQTSYEIIEAP